MCRTVCFATDPSQAHEKDLKFLEHKIDEQEQALEKQDFTRYSEADSEFHCYMVDLLNNRRLSEFYANIRIQYRAASNSTATEHSKVPIQEHREIPLSVDIKKIFF